MRACDLDAFSRVLVWPHSGHLFAECQKELAPLLLGAQEALQTPPAPKATRSSPRCPGCDDSSRTPGPSGWPVQGPLLGTLEATSSAEVARGDVLGGKDSPSRMLFLVLAGREEWVYGEK